MKNKKYLLLIPVVALGLTACQDPTTTTTTSDPRSYSLSRPYNNNYNK